ncbi:hypothetical protein LG298_07465 [Cytobacillus firmus]|uniref:hypothetical protein n=1 Tax=Cytobacillus firmus TaxID=1399 RepID=UPI00384F9B9C
MGLFKNEGKKTEMEKNMEELQINAGTLQELHTEKAKFEGVLRGLAIELELGEDSSLTKRFKKVEKKVNELQKEIEELNARQAELNQAIAEEKVKERQAQIKEAGEAYSERVYKVTKVHLFKNEVEDKMKNFLHRKSGGVGKAEELLKLAGVTGADYQKHFNPKNPEHTPFIETQNEAYKAGREKAQKEFEKLMKQINDFLERNE